jgi:hypothetical protein
VAACDGLGGTRRASGSCRQLVIIMALKPCRLNVIGLSQDTKSQVTCPTILASMVLPMPPRPCTAAPPWQAVLKTAYPHILTCANCPIHANWACIRHDQALSGQETANIGQLAGSRAGQPPGHCRVTATMCACAATELVGAKGHLYCQAARARTRARTPAARPSLSRQSATAFSWCPVVHTSSKTRMWSPAVRAGSVIFRALRRVDAVAFFSARPLPADLSVACVLMIAAGIVTSKFHRRL